MLDDTYNANPQSVEVALRSLTRLKGPHRSIAVLGDMGELGQTTEASHRQIGRLVAELDLDFLYTLGDCAAQVAAGAREAGMDCARIQVAEAADVLGRELRACLRKGDVVLVKGSRAMRMERIVDELRAGGST